MKIEKVDKSHKKITNIKRFLKTTGADWDVTLEDIRTVTRLHVKDRKAIVKNSNPKKVIGVVGNRYQPEQNIDAFKFFDIICKNNGAEYHYLYNIDDGRKVIVQAKMGEFEVRPGDMVSEYATLINSFDGTTPKTVFFTTQRNVSGTQLSSSIRHTENKICFKHATHDDFKIHDSDEVLARADEYYYQFKIWCKKFDAVKVNDELISKFLDKLFGVTPYNTKSKKRINNKQSVIDSFKNGIGNNGETLWDLVNGVTDWVDLKRSNTENKRLASSIDGSGFKIKEQAFKAAIYIIEITY